MLHGDVSPRRAPSAPAPARQARHTGLSPPPDTDPPSAEPRRSDTVPMGPQRAAASGGHGDARPICPMPAPCRPPPALPVVFISDPPSPHSAPTPPRPGLIPTCHRHRGLSLCHRHCPTRRRRMEPPGRGSEDDTVSVDDSPGAASSGSHAWCSPRWASEPALCQPLPLCLHHPLLQWGKAWVCSLLAAHGHLCSISCPHPCGPGLPSRTERVQARERHRGQCPLPDTWLW